MPIVRVSVVNLITVCVAEQQLFYFAVLLYMPHTYRTYYDCFRSCSPCGDDGVSRSRSRSSSSRGSSGLAPTPSKFRPIVGQCWPVSAALGPGSTERGPTTSTKLGPTKFGPAFDGIDAHQALPEQRQGDSSFPSRLRRAILRASRRRVRRRVSGQRPSAASGGIPLSLDAPARNPLATG